MRVYDLARSYIRGILLCDGDIFTAFFNGFSFDNIFLGFFSRRARFHAMDLMFGMHRLTICTRRNDASRSCDEVTGCRRYYLDIYFAVDINFENNRQHI